MKIIKTIGTTRIGMMKIGKMMTMITNHLVVVEAHQVEVVHQVIVEVPQITVEEAVQVLIPLAQDVASQQCQKPIELA